MTVGLPGVGLGGIFYLASAIIMPLREAVRLGRRTGAPRGWLVVRQTALAGGILLALWATGWLLGHAIDVTSRAAPAIMRGVPIAAGANALRVSALFLSLGTLALVLGSVQAARLVMRLRDARERRTAERNVLSPVENAEGLRVDSGTFGRVR
jgi:hypothetical protein